MLGGIGVARWPRLKGTSPTFSPVFEAKGAKRNEIWRSRKMSERRHTCGTSRERIEKAPEIVVVCALQPDSGEKVGLARSRPETALRVFEPGVQRCL